MKPGEIIRTGIASFGMSGKLFHAPFIGSHPGFELAAIVERHREESREKYPDSRLYRSFEEMISDPRLGLIVVNTPVQTHFEYARIAIMAGKAVVVEKPFTVTEKEARELDELSKEHSTFLSVYQNRRYDGDYRALRDVVHSNLLGELREVEMRYDRYRPSCGGKKHKEGNLPGAGTLHDIGSHLIDQALQLFGMPEAVFADIWTMRSDVAANDYFELLLYYPRMRVRIKGTVIAREAYPAYILHGMKGSFLQQRSDLQEQQLLAGVIPSLESWCPMPDQPDGLLHTETGEGVIRKATTSLPGNYMRYYDDVYKALTRQGTNPVPASDAVKTMQVIDAAMESNHAKGLVTIGG